MRARYFAAVLAAVLVVSVAGVAVWHEGPATALRDGRPNIIIVLTDDQRADTLASMRTVRKELRAMGADYTGLIPTSTCCPSRTALLSGNHSHTTGVWSNKPLSGGWPTFYERGFEEKTIATALSDSGYNTGFFGKYLNYWNRSPDGYIPPGWNEFHAMWQEAEGGPGAGAYYNYELRGTDPPEVFGSEPEDYSTRVIGDRALQFIEDAELAGTPYLAFIATTSPHANMRPDPKDEDEWQPREPYDNPAVNAPSSPDKPKHMQDLDRVDMDKIWRDQDRTGEALISVDRMVRHVMQAADMSNTLFIYMGDNGYMWGEHRLGAKNWPNRWSTEVPLIMRWDGQIEPGDYGLATNVDVGATVLDAANAADAFPVDGKSLLNSTRRFTVLEANEWRRKRPAYCGVRTTRYRFTQYATGEREVYDYKLDPYELDNLAGEAAYADLEERLRSMAYDACNPTAPGFYWSAG